MTDLAAPHLAALLRALMARKGGGGEREAGERKRCDEAVRAWAARLRAAAEERVAEAEAAPAGPARTAAVAAARSAVAVCEGFSDEVPELETLSPPPPKSFAVGLGRAGGRGKVVGLWLRYRPGSSG